MSEYHVARLARALSFAGVATPAELPWGAFTGVHPIRYIRQNRDKLDIIDELQISADKLALADEVIAVQEEILRGLRERAKLLYIGIPFCPSRCKYCSFVSESVEKSHKLIPEYVDVLVGELATITKADFTAVYIGGGTPTSLPLSELERVLATLVMTKTPEFTLEAGRPETITDENLRLADKFGVSRISINPQSMNDKTLRIIGRGHDSAEIYKAYEKARKYDFVVNMDLIGGLPDETRAEFVASLNKVIALAPENITVHSFAHKRAADFFKADENTREDFTQVAYDILKAAGYFPYYLYRQSNCAGDNIGYSRKREYVCAYNIHMTDESAEVFGAGCGASSRHDDVKSYNPKFPHEYISRARRPDAPQ